MFNHKIKNKRLFIYFVKMTSIIFIATLVYKFFFFSKISSHFNIFLFICFFLSQTLQTILRKARTTALNLCV